jgi:hypothetical protein
VGLEPEGRGFDFRRYQIFWEVVGLERSPFSLVSTIKELLGRKSRSFGLESREYGRKDPSRWPRDTLYPQKLALNSPISGGCSVGIICSQTQATFSYCSIPWRCLGKTTSRDRIIDRSTETRFWFVPDHVNSFRHVGYHWWSYYLPSANALCLKAIRSALMKNCFYHRLWEGYKLDAPNLLLDCSPPRTLTSFTIHTHSLFFFCLLTPALHFQNS